MEKRCAYGLFDVRASSCCVHGGGVLHVFGGDLGVSKM